ncbi:trifunctional transcriptional regulator/proline dehydrogenase/L-glutamate gamma-semialdehyde dehydrogenase [Parapusillimonas granuli]|uniref:Bifunctional protein PutA n=1 Tax=Parapusillimonas granuli TaxID=380911 RepID=A0A853FUP5_9BURK|nr:trifunctional transcriptional regulator/proline dehydrogenase/L-glutamate gamma-semialdehyde dehydrogenase [Parapusillimonas granuli]MBB5215648.1 RHH-type proline utilization regulon transcriptional repressor/proline dehydrogenase/delta 1-pyrroline-5-carboxylate dehydrogenase [Parapusillimonas granuli]NYT49685.1 trifunctional transcriptional regulator/proline dehydrogenase/L-glutamate gamma-semialdehyde dehydrogenase [Parapusillimonas granuli]
MASTNLGVKVDSSIRNRLKSASELVGRTPHWLHKQALISFLEQIERGRLPPAAGEGGDDGPLPLADEAEWHNAPPFFMFSQDVRPQSVLRAAITSAYRRAEPECLPLLLEQAQVPRKDEVRRLATELVTALRKKRAGRGVEALIKEFSLSSQEGIALMCLAEALLRIPDRATRDALIRDKISKGDWKAHIGGSSSLFINAAVWGLLITGKLASVNSEQRLSKALSHMIGKGGEPLIRQGVNMAMRMMGEQFVSGQTISEAIANSRKMESKGFRHSYDMLGESATTAQDAERYYRAYELAIHAIGKASAGRGIYEGPGISIKLSALHPRYSRRQHDRVMDELYPRLLELTKLARQYDVGLNIDAEEADSLEISLDLLEALCAEPDLKGWNGIGFVIQSYQKRAPYVIDYMIDLARRSRRRLMVRLVKGAYWDTEIKRAQESGLEGYPVYTRKVYTDVSYLACAARLLAAPGEIYPQFATHNAYTLAAVYYMAGENYYPGQYEFQCLHGMGEALYEEVVGPVSQSKLNRPCRIYAPVGTHEILLPYLVRRLLENSANTSFVNLLRMDGITTEQLVADPVDAAKALWPLGVPHERIPLPRDLYRGDGQARLNAQGIDLTNEHRLGSLAAALANSVNRQWKAAPMLGDGEGWDPDRAEPVINPADHRDIVGHVVHAGLDEVARALEQAAGPGSVWQATPVEERAQCLRRASDMLEGDMQSLIGLIVREAGKPVANAMEEVREAVDFLRYYADQIEREFGNDTHRPLGVVACLSPWNFPLAIFMGQVAAALAAGNTVIAKPAEQTPLIAAQAVSILRAAGVPDAAVQLLPGDGETVGQALAAASVVGGVAFTGSTDAARHIARTLSTRLSDHGGVIPFIAETGGQNAMVVDSSALPEQVVLDVLASAFDSAGQRCSALRALFVQEDCADKILHMLEGAMRELAVGNPDRLSVDVGPVIDADAKARIEAHIQAMRAAGCRVEQLPLPPEARHGTFVPPTLIELPSLDMLTHEVFGPVLHVLRYRREEIGTVIDAINGTGYGLAFGVHTRIDEMVAYVSSRVRAGNIYVNRSIVGAVVGAQPFGGEGLSGTGPKAGGPLYLYRLLSRRPAHMPAGIELAAGLPQTVQLPGPTGEHNTYTVVPRGAVLCLAASEEGARRQWEACRLTGNQACFVDVRAARAALGAQGAEQDGVSWVAMDRIDAAPVDAVLFEGDSDALRELNRRLALRDGPLLQVQGLTPEAIRDGAQYLPEPLLRERSLSVNTTAAGGNAGLMAIG